jgi:hypothetical protein
MKDAPVLILAYNRPAQVRGLVDSLRTLRPMKILVGVDGPKDSQADREKVVSVLKEINEINWTDDVEIRSRDINLGIRRAVPDSVGWAIEKYGEAIVLEDDVRPGPEFFQFMNFALRKYRNSEQVGHVSGYNLVPKEFISHPETSIRFSLYPESYAWATWNRAWVNYSDSLDWALQLSSRELTNVVGSWLGAKVWRFNFTDASSDAISTWAYRWVASLWKNKLVSISPNRNISSYTGRDGGTHTRTPGSWKELGIESINSLESPVFPTIDGKADKWIGKNVFRSSPLGSIRRMAESNVLTLLKNIQ